MNKNDKYLGLKSRILIYLFILLSGLVLIFIIDKKIEDVFEKIFLEKNKSLHQEIITIDNEKNN
jgi:hypothetical protein